MDDAISYGVGAVHGGDGDGAKPVVRESFERRGKTIDGAVVAHHAVTVEGTEGEADAERRQDAVLIETRCLHVAQCFRFQHLPTRTAPPVEEHGDETAEVGHGAVQALSRHRARRKRGCRKHTPVVRPHEPFSAATGELRRGLEAAHLEPHGPEHVALDVLGERFAGFLLERKISDRGSGIRVLGSRAWRINKVGAVEAADYVGEQWRTRVEGTAVGRLTHQSGAVRHQVAQRDRRAERVRRMEVRQDLLDGRVEVQLAALHKLHHADGGEELGHRANPVHCLGRGGSLLLGIGVSEALRPDNLVAIHHRDRKRRELLLGQLLLDELRERGRYRGVILPRRDVPGVRAESRRGRKEQDNEDAAEAIHSFRRSGEIGGPHTPFCNRADSSSRHLRLPRLAPEFGPSSGRTFSITGPSPSR